MYNTAQQFRTRVAQLSILSGIIAAVSLVFISLGTAFQFEVFSEPGRLLEMENADSQFLKWSMILDMLGYYLLLLPAYSYFKNYLKAKTAWHHVISWCGSAYILLGAIGSAILAAVIPQMMVAYPVATANEQAVLMSQFTLVMELVHGGLWNTLEILLAAAWWLGIGYGVRRERPKLGYISLVLGFSCLLDSFGTMTGNEALAGFGLNIYLVLAIVWAIWFGAGLLRTGKSIQVSKKALGKMADYEQRNWSLVN